MSTPSLLNIPYVIKAGTLYSQIPETGAGDFVVSRTTSPTPNRSTRVNANGFIERVNDNVPRLDYPLGGAVNGCASLLVEPAATNGIRNNSMVGAVTGSPGTLPTNWTNEIGTLTQTIVATGVVSGIAYIDIRLSGTASLSINTITFETTTAITASVGQTWTESVYLSVVSAPNPPTNYRAAIQERNAGGGYLTDGSQNLTLTSNLTRYSFTRTLTNATTARVTPALYFTTTIGQTYDFTIRIGYPQMEIGSVATSVIPTDTQAITRGADVINKTSIASLIGQSEGTIYAEVDIRAFANLGVFLSISNGGGNDRIEIYKNTDSKIYFDRVSATQSGTTSVASNILTTGIFKVAVAYKSGDTIMYINGSAATTAQTQTFTFLPITKITIGTNRADINQFNDRIRPFAIYPNRLSNAELIALTTP